MNMLLPASSMVKITRFPLSRCLFVLQEIRARALARDVAEIAAQIGLAIPRVQDALDLDQRQRASRTSRFPVEARDVDELVDASVVGLDDYCESQMSLFRGEPRAGAAARVKRALLPEGVASIVRLPYADQHTRIDALLARAQAPDLLDDVALLPDMTAVLGRMRALNGHYGEILRDHEGRLTRQDVRARQDECHELLCSVACLVIGHFVTLPERHADRDYLLEPILRENEALRERRRRRRADGDASQDPDGVLPEPDDAGDPADFAS
jgi:hypothetical protein